MRGAHVQCVRSSGAEVPGRIEVVQLVVFVNDLGGMGVMICQSLVLVAIVGDAHGVGGLRGVGGNSGLR